jgi:hypothetical protein
MMSKRNAIKLFRADATGVPSLGNLLKPVQYAIRRFSDLMKDREKGAEMIYVRKRQESDLGIRQKLLEREIKEIYSGAS